MTRDYSFTLTDITKWYNLWDDLIAKDSSFTNAAFGSAAYVPDRVSELEYQNQTLGATLQKSDSRKKHGFELTGGSWDVKRAPSNSIDLKNINFLTDTNPTTVYVSIVAH